MRMRLFGPHHFVRRFPLVAYSAKLVGQTKVNFAASTYNSFGNYFASLIYCRPMQSIPSLRRPVIPWESSSSAILLEKIDSSLKSDCVDDVWEEFNNFKKLHGFPEPHLLSRVIVFMSYSSDRHWLRKAYDLALLVLEEKPHLLHHDSSLMKLALSLVRNQMAIPASAILRIMLEKDEYPPMDIWRTLFFHLVKAETGSYLASDILIEICGCFLHHNSLAKKPKKKRLARPDVTLFNLVLDSCARYGSVVTAQEIIDLMPQVGVAADANSIIIIARIYEAMGRRDELNKLKSCIDGLSSVTLNRHYQQFYDCLLSLHFKYNDIDAAAELVLGLYRRPKSIHSHNGLLPRSSMLQKHCLVQIGSNNLRVGYKIMVDPDQLQKDFAVEARRNLGLVLFMDGELVPSNKALSKLINGFVRKNEVAKLSNLLISIQEMDPDNSILTADVVNACIYLGWLETAHDILDDFVSAGIPVGSDTYKSLLRAYCERNMFEESELLLKQMRKAGHLASLSSENAMSLCLLEDCVIRRDTENSSSVVKVHLAELLDRESRKENSTTRLVYEFNSIILFFCKAKMIDDALRTFKQMQRANVQPTALSFNHLVNCYSSLKLYRDITILWGEIRRKLEDGVLNGNRDLFECLLWNFLRGGYFERAMEIINYMTKHNMFIDKLKYRREFLKLHKELYRNLKASDVRTDAQSRRFDYVRAFKRWAGIDPKS